MNFRIGANRPGAKRLGGRNDQGRNDLGRNAAGAKRLGGELDLGRNDPDSYIVGCWRHLKKDIEAWSLKHQVVKQESKRLVDDIFFILRTKDNVQPLLESKRENWPGL